MDEEIIKTDKSFTQLFNQKKSIVFKLGISFFIIQLKKRVIVNKCYVKKYVKIIVMLSS